MAGSRQSQPTRSTGSFILISLSNTSEGWKTLASFSHFAFHRSQKHQALRGPSATLHPIPPAKGWSKDPKRCFPWDITALRPPSPHYEAENHTGDSGGESQPRLRCSQQAFGSCCNYGAKNCSICTSSREHTSFR